MTRKQAFGASTALVLSFLIGISIPAFAERGGHDHGGKQQAAHDRAVHAQRQERRIQARQAAQIRQAEQRASRIERNSARLQARQVKQAEQARLRQVRAADRLQLEKLRSDRKVAVQQSVFNQQLSKEQFRARESLRRREFASQLQAERRSERLRLQELRQQNRLAAYRVQSDYLDRLEQQRLSLLSSRDVFAYNNPAYYTTPYYGYFRGGNYFTTSQYGGSLLQQAVNYGCNQGLSAGVADRNDRWSFNPTSSLIYRDASYGYSGILVPRSDYNYYFRKGYSRCYREGFYGRSSSANGVVNSVLNAVLGLQYLR